MKKAVVLFTVLCGVGALQAAEEVRLSWSHEADFSKLETYGWMSTQQPLPNEANHIRMTEAIENAFERKGLKKAAFGEPQVLLLYRAGIEQEVGAKSYQTVSSFDPTAVKTMMDFHREKKGTLTIEMYDGESRQIIWRAEGSNVLPSPDKMEKAITRAVHSLVRHYPPGSTPDPPLR